MTIIRVFLIALLFLLCIFLCHPPALSTAREKLKNAKLSCYFGLKRSSHFETHERVPATMVSTTCGTVLKKMDTLLEPTTMELYGASSKLDIAVTRGSSFYSKNERDLKPFLDLYICDAHEKELLTRWSGTEYNHIKREVQENVKHRLCSFPFAEENHHTIAEIGGHKTYYVQKEDAKMFTEATGHHIHVGTPVCEEHHNLLHSIIEEHKSIDKDWNMQDECRTVDTSVTFSPIELITRALHSLADALGLSGYISTKPFPDYADDTKRKKADMGHKMFGSVLTLLAPGHESELYPMIERKFHPRNWDRNLEHSFDVVMRVLAEQFMLAPTLRLRDFTLALIAGKFPYAVVHEYIPNLSIYKYQKARKIALSGKFHPVIDDKILVRYDDEAVISLIEFITSDLVLVGLPYGEKTVTTSSGEKLIIPNTVRMMSQSEIVRQFPLYMIAQGKEKHILSASSIVRLLNAIPATNTHSMSCVDSFLAKGNYAFSDLLSTIDRLNQMSVFNVDQKNQWRNSFLEVQLYLKTDFKLHAKKESIIADHCLIYALSDPEDPFFRHVESHTHVQQCPRCTHMSKSFTELLKIIVEASEASSSDEVKKELAEIHFRVKSHQEIIKRLRNHELRSAFATIQRGEIIDNLQDRECLVTADFATKFLSTYYWAEQSLFFGQTGHTWHLSHSLCKLVGQFVQHTFIHLLNTDHQDSVTVTHVLNHVAQQLKELDIDLIHIRTDNGACYHSAGTLGSIPEIMKDTGLKIASFSFSESQSGKGSADRVCASGKGVIRRYIDSGKDVKSLHDMFLALTSGNILRGVTVYEATVTSPSKEDKNDWKIPGIADMGHFDYETGSDGKVTMRYWKYHNIGPGKTITTMKANKGQMVVFAKGSRVFIEPGLAQKEIDRLKNNEETLFWINDVNRNSVDEPFDTDDDSVDPVVPPPKQPLPPDALFYCWCGSEFIRFQNLLNHLEWGRHKICPEKTTMCDYGIGAFKRTIEDSQQAASLFPLRDTLSCTVDDSVPPLEEGFGLRSRAHGGALPESSRKFVVKYFEDEKKKGNHKPDPTAAMTLQNLAIDVPFEDRLTFEQIRCLYSRLSKAKTPKKTKRATDRDDDDSMNGSDGEGDDEGYGYGEWDEDCLEPENPEHDPEFIIFKYIHQHNKSLFDHSL